MVGRCGVSECARRCPNRVFLRFEGREWTYREVNSVVNRYASVLAAHHGVGRGDVVGLMLTNRPEALFLVLATVKLGRLRACFVLRLPR